MIWKKNQLYVTLDGINLYVYFTGYPVSVSGMLTVPVSASMYQTVVANIQQINNDGTVQVGLLC